MMFRRKLKNKRAFTLAETLVATLIMLMVSAIMIAGIPAAKSAYDGIIVRSNAEVALSTAITALRNEMSVARDVKMDGTTVTYVSGTYGSYSKIYLDSNNEVQYQRYAYVNKDSGAANEESTKLISDSASNHMVIKYNSVSQTGNVITFNGLGVYKSANASNPILARNVSIGTF